ncbi:MAG: hypothetical protein A3F11_06380 [Gammaproteobacteria bacterium RIFCSPHIGHO2_12_FULL_37_14]|nr:MAG: hypothetical protein A3F11_06380 [Gammaproteobacteria bacterium RIFCSPHIGHO2_12_FULL_37_14]
MLRQYNNTASLEKPNTSPTNEESLNLMPGWQSDEKGQLGLLNIAELKMVKPEAFNPLTKTNERTQAFIDLAEIYNEKSNKNYSDFITNKQTVIWSLFEALHANIPNKINGSLNDEWPTNLNLNQIQITELLNKLDEFFTLEENFHRNCHIIVETLRRIKEKDKNPIILPSGMEKMLEVLSKSKNPFEQNKLALIELRKNSSVNGKDVMSFLNNLLMTYCSTENQKILFTLKLYSLLMTEKLNKKPLKLTPAQQNEWGTRHKEVLDVLKITNPNKVNRGGGTQTMDHPIDSYTLLPIQLPLQSEIIFLVLIKNTIHEEKPRSKTLAELLQLCPIKSLTELFQLHQSFLASIKEISGDLARVITLIDSFPQAEQELIWETHLTRIYQSYDDIPNLLAAQPDINPLSHPDLMEQGHQELIKKIKNDSDELQTLIATQTIASHSIHEDPLLISEQLSKLQNELNTQEKKYHDACEQLRLENNRLTIQLQELQDQVTLDSTYRKETENRFGQKENENKEPKNELDTLLATVKKLRVEAENSIQTSDSQNNITVPVSGSFPNSNFPVSNSQQITNKEESARPAATKTPWWIYPLLGLGIIAGIALLATGIGAFVPFLGIAGLLAGWGITKAIAIGLIVCSTLIIGATSTSIHVHRQHDTSVKKQHSDLSESEFFNIPSSTAQQIKNKMPAPQPATINRETTTPLLSKPPINNTRRSSFYSFFLGKNNTQDLPKQDFEKTPHFKRNGNAFDE